MIISSKNRSYVRYYGSLLTLEEIERFVLQARVLLLFYR
jgi:hypothetical protein